MNFDDLINPLTDYVFQETIVGKKPIDRMYYDFGKNSS